jgi:hypothetical protein
MGRITRSAASAVVTVLTFGVLLLGAGRAQGAPAASSKAGLLRINSTPMSQVYLEGESIGLTPIMDYSLRAGTYRVELRISDGRSKAFQIQMKPGSTLTVVRTFGPPRLGGPGTLSVTSEPWSQVFLDGRAVGTTPLEAYRAKARSYNLELRTSDGRTYKRIVFVEAGQVTQVAHRFPSPKDPPPAGPTGWLDVVTDPPSEVWVDGKKVGNTPLKDHDLPVGLREVVLKTEDGRRHSRQLQIVRDKTTLFNFRFPPKEVVEDGPNMGRLSVTSNVEAEVLVDGRHAGWTPFLSHPIKPGRHRITLVAQKRHRRSYTLQIVTGRTQTISVTFPVR